MTVTIGARTIGPGHPAFIIAEAGVNHNGSPALAHQLITAGAASGVDCVKFQTFKAERVATPAAPKAAYQLEVTDRSESQIAMLRGLELTETAYPELITACAKAGLAFMSTPYNEEDVDFLAGLNVPALKLASIHAAEPSLLRYAAATGKPIILSTGMCTMDEVKQAVAAVHGAGNRQLILLQCTTNYPSATADANLRAMTAMRDQLGVLVGYSDHTQSDTACIASIALGACVIEKHLTLDKTMKGPDQPTSLEPREMARLVTAIRETESALGDSVKRPAANEVRNIAGMRRGIVARRAIAKGTVIGAGDLILKRPLSEVPPGAWDKVVGATAARDIAEGAALTKRDVGGNMTIYMSSGAFRTKSLRGVIDEARRLGITHVELSSGLAHEPALEDTVRAGMAAGLTFLIHNYFPAPAAPQVLNLTSGDPEGLRWSLDHCRKAIDLSVLVGGGFYSLHSGYVAALKAHQLGKPAEQAEAFKNTVIDRAGAIQLMIRSVREVADYAATRGKDLVLENNVISPLYLSKAPANPLLMTDAEEIAAFMAAVDRPNVGFLIDMGHAKVSATALGFDPHAFLDRVRPYVRALHLSDNDGREDQNLPFGEQAWFFPRLAEFRGLPWVIEAYEMADGVMARQMDVLAKVA